MILRISVFILLLSLLLGHAQTAANEDRSAAISHARMRSLLRDMGFEFTENSSGDAIAFAFPLNGRNVTLLNHVSSMRLSACFAGVVDLMKRNQWNREHFSTGAYFDEQGCTSLQADVNFSGGVTNEMIKEFVSAFCTDVAIFARLVAQVRPAPNTPSASAATGAQLLDRDTSPIGTMAWTQLAPYAKSAPAWPGTIASRPGSLKINRNISLRYDPGQWRQKVSHNRGQFAFSRSSGAGHALVIAERIAIPLSSVQDVALANAQLVDPHAKIVFRNKRRVNGFIVWFLKIEADVDTVPMVYCGYFYGGENGTVQVVTYTEKSRFPEYEKGFMDFLNGLVVSR